MSNFGSFTSQTNFIVIILLHPSALKPQAKFSHQFVVVIKIGGIVSLIYCR